MMGPRQVDQAALFYEFSLERHVPATHLLRSIDRFVDLSEVRGHLAPFYSSTGRPSIDPELLVWMLLVGYCCGIRSERRLCEEVHLNLAYRWFCRLGPDGEVLDHSTFSKNKDGRRNTGNAEHGNSENQKSRKELAYASARNFGIGYGSSDWEQLAIVIQTEFCR
jgi:transposase